MGETFWVRLNQNPLPTLPIEAGERARRNWESLSKKLRQEQEQVYPNVWDNPVCSFPEFVVERKNLEQMTNSKKWLDVTRGSFLFWSQSCLFNDGRYDAVSWGFGLNIRLSRNRKISYQDRCPPHEDSPEYDRFEWKDDSFPSRFTGFFIMDWDEDGDEDIAFLLVTGGYLFFRQECCDCLIA